MALYTPFRLDGIALVLMMNEARTSELNTLNMSAFDLYVSGTGTAAIYLVELSKILR